MDFLKKNYEKVLLGLVLVGLAVALVFLQFVVSSEQQKLSEITNEVFNPKVTALTNLDLTLATAALKRVATPAMIDFGSPNRLFNPMPWQKTADGRLVPIDKVGPQRLVVTNIEPLVLRLSLDQVTTTDTGPKYTIGIDKQISRTKRSAYCTMNPPSKNETFTMLEVKGKPDDPSQIVVELNDSKEKAVIGKDKPFERIDGYMADFRYDLEKKSWPARRVGAVLPFNGEDYKVVAINQNEAILAAPNQKKWTIKATPNPSQSAAAP